MYRYKVERDQQQNTNLTFCCDDNIVLIKCCKVTHLHLHHPQTKLLLQFNVHQNHDHHTLWAALEHTLKDSFDNIVASEILPTSVLKTHVFVLSQNQHIQSSIFNAVWLSFLLHGIPLKDSVYMHQWKDTIGKGKAIFSLHDPTFPISGDYSSPPPSQTAKHIQNYKKSIMQFLSHV